MNGSLSRILSPQQNPAQLLALVGQAIIEYGVLVALGKQEHVPNFFA